MQSTSSAVSVQESQEGGFSATTSPAANHPISTTTTTPEPRSSTAAMKRPPSPSPPAPTTSSLSSHQFQEEEQRYKKQATSPPGFTQLTITATTSSTPLRRTASAPIYTPAPFAPFTGDPSIRPEASKMIKWPDKSQSPLPPQPNRSRRLLHSASNPSAALTPSWPTAKVSPSAQNLKKVKRIVRGITQLFNEAIQGGDEENSVKDDHNNNITANNAERHRNADSDGNNQENVSVEQKGNSSLLKFSCPCGKTYQILLSRNNNDCYYKLM